MKAPAAPFCAPHPPVRSLADVRRIEAVPLAEALTARSTYDIFVNSAAAFGERTALSFLPTGEPDEQPLHCSYRLLLAGIHQTANLLHTLGITPGDAVALLLPAGLDHHLALWGGEAAAIVQPLNPLLADDKLAALLNATRARALFAYGADGDSGYWAKALRLRAQVPSLLALLRVAPHGEAEVPALPPGVIDFGRRRAEQPADRLLSGRHIAPGDIAAYFHTGGTTGAPKLARHSHHNQVFSAWGAVQLQGTGPDDVVLNGYPLFHVAGVLPASLAALSAGAQTVIPSAELLRNRTVMRNYWRLVERHRVTVLPAVPTVLATLVDLPLDGADISSLRYVRTGAAPLPPQLAARFEQHLGLPVHESLGMTETAGLTAIRPPGVRGPAGCVGFVLPHARVRVVVPGPGGQAGMQEAAAGTAGVLQVRAPNVFAGYLDAEETARTFSADGWLDTGDIGFVDADGMVHLSGRAKDLIIRSGHNIDPMTIEDTLCRHPAVLQCAAVGAPDAYAGEVPVVFAVLRPGSTASADELLAFAARHVDEAPARPKALTLLDALPLTNVGKVYKPSLRALAHAAVVRTLVDAAWAEVVIVNDSVQIVVDPACSSSTLATLRELLAALPVPTPLRQGDRTPHRIPPTNTKEEPSP